MRRTIVTLAACLASALALSGCLSEETAHTLYLEPDGTVTWSVLESDIHSTDPPRSGGDAEEAEWLAAAVAGRHPVALALAELDPVEIQSQVLRSRPPFAAHTEATFASLDQLSRAILDRLGVPAEVAVERVDTEIRFQLVIHTAEPAAHDDDDDALAPLASDLADYRLVLSRGRFVDAVGFELREQGRMAVPLEQSEQEVSEHGGDIVLSLTWSE